MPSHTKVCLELELPKSKGLGYSIYLHYIEMNYYNLSKRPAAAVIPAPIAYIKVVAVKKLVVEPWAWLAGPPHRVHWSGRAFPSGEPHALHWVCRGTRTFTLKKLECSKQAYARIH